MFVNLYEWVVECSASVCIVEYVRLDMHVYNMSCFRHELYVKT